MMNVFDISEIEDAVKEIVEALKITESVFTSRPSSTDNTMKNFIVVKVSGGVRDLAAYGECTISISLFAKDVSNVKNSKKLSYLQRQLFENFPSDKGRFLFDNTPVVIADAPDGFGYHARIINVKTIVKV